MHKGVLKHTCVDLGVKWMTKKEIRKMLHPTLGEDYLPEGEEKLGPGIKSLNSLYASMFNKSKKRLKMTQRPFCRVKEF